MTWTNLSGTSARRRIITPPVLEITLRASMTPEAIRAVIDGATCQSPEGRFVRLRVGATPPPLWIDRHMRRDLCWQIDGDDERILTAWLRLLSESEADHE